MSSYMSVSTAAYDGYGFDQIIPSLARCGVRHVELAFIDGYVEAFTDADLSLAFADDLKREMHRYGQECRYFSGHIDLGKEDASARLEARCRFAAGLGASFVITNAAALGRRDSFFRQTETLAAIARHYGIRILLENPGNAAPNLFDHSGQMKALFERLDRDDFGINFDVGNLLSHCPDRDPVSEALTVMADADHFHLKACMKVQDGFDFTELGKGDIDDAEVVRALLKAGKPFSLELPFRLHRHTNAQPWRDDVPLSIETIEGKLSRSLEWISLHANND